MLVLSQLNKKVLAFLMFVCSFAFAQTSSVETMRSRENRQGLYEVREAARNFIEKWNKEHNTSFKALEPDLKNGGARCAVPLYVKWVTKDYGMYGKNVFVVCDKTFDTVNDKKWKMVVPVVE